MKPRSHPFAALGAVLALLTTASLTAGPAAYGDTTLGRCGVVFDQAGIQVWTGVPDVRVVEAADGAAKVLTQRPETLLDVSLCQDSSGVLVKGIPGVELDEIVSQLRKEHPEVAFYRVSSANSMDQLRRVRADVSKLPELQIIPNAMQIDPNSERVVVELDAATPAGKRAFDKLSGLGLVDVKASEDFGSSSTVWGDRNSDYEPFQAGGIVNPSGCSLGPRLRLNGQEMILTAGHCGYASQYMSGSGSNLVIGTRHTTSYPGNADMYGDWQLIKGKDYSDWVFNGAPYNDNSSLQGTGLNTSWRARGLFLCSSGMTTGQWCRARILYIDATYTFDDPSFGSVTAGKLYTTIQDTGNSADYGKCLYTGQNGDAPDGYDRGGDSGGAVYHSNGTTPNTVTYDGLVTGSSWVWLGSWSCKYYYTSLVGVKTWNSGVGW